MPMNSKMLETTIKTKAIAALKTCTSMVPNSDGVLSPVNIFDAASVQAVMGVDPKTITYKGKPMTGTDALVTIIAEVVAAEVVTHIQSFAQVTTTVNTTVATIPVATAGSPAAQTGATVSPGVGTGAGTGKVA